MEAVGYGAVVAGTSGVVAGTSGGVAGEVVIGTTVVEQMGMVTVPGVVTG